MVKAGSRSKLSKKRPDLHEFVADCCAGFDAGSLS